MVDGRVVGLLLSLVAGLVGCVPFADLATLGVPLACLAGSVLRIRRAHVEDAMAEAGVQSPGQSAWEMYASLAAGIVELLWLAGAGRRDLSRVVRLDPDSQTQLDEVFRKRDGAPPPAAVFGASHTGNWELAACAMAARIPMSVLVKPVSLGVLDRFMTRVRARYGVGLISGEGGLVEARRELEAGRVVALLVDQVPVREANGDWLPFLGRAALTDRAPAALAATVGCPFVVTASRRDANGEHWLHVLSVKRPPARGRARWIEAATREATMELAAFVERHPDQWLWLHRRWRDALQ